ncbi:MAG TPA: 16S rRNA (uracil(1498)-N(3))-methyltransferase [Casimicrobiaceae bacterium]|jgi:16S rRNA (uracil1498-N3)-methyltransferase|nr:16S rRNA (uracil(1498)-N(3))-methyltransferase [Casimicrobiaceae bacterium]
MAPRIFVGDDATAFAPGGEYRLPPHAARHVAQALRMRIGDALTLFTGLGGEYAATLAHVDRRDVVVRVERHDPIERESMRAATLVQSLIAAEMMDFVVRKAVELGAAAIVPIQAARSQAIAADRAERRVAHWRQIAIAACEQCGRNRIPDVSRIATFDEWIDAHADAAAILDLDAKRSLAAQTAIAAPRAIAVGPEGGFTADEVQRATSRGAIAVHLGRRVLRAETAAVAALATLDAIAGDAK